MARITFDAAEFARLADALDRLPPKMRKIAFGRAAARARKVVERNYAQFASRTLKVAQKHIKARMTSHLADGAVTLVVKSTQIPLNEMNPSQRGYGVFVKGRKRYEGAFIVNQGAAKAAGLVLRRAGPARLPTQMLFGPNPAHAIERKPDDYEDLLAEIARDEFAKVILQQVEYLLGQAA